VHRRASSRLALIAAVTVVLEACASVSPYSGPVACENERQEVCDRAAVLAAARVEQPLRGWRRVHVGPTNCSPDDGCVVFVSFEPRERGAIPVVEVAVGSDGALSVTRVGHGDPPPPELPSLSPPSPQDYVRERALVCIVDASWMGVVDKPGCKRYRVVDSRLRSEAR
jgi:hypothetical protein